MKRKIINETKKQTENDTKEFKPKPVSLLALDYITYIRKHSDYCDDWTLEFINDIDEKVKLSITLSQKQFFLLERKAKEIFIEKNLNYFHSDILTN